MKIAPDFLEGKHRIHFIGIGGSGMFPLAQILQKKGYEITGSDNNPGDTIDLERKLGMEVSLTQCAQNIEGADAIVYSAAILPENPELMAARESGIPLLERSGLLGLITSWYKDCIAVCGTHGKTTTTAMLTHILLHAQKSPSAIIGGRLQEIGGNGLTGDSDILVCEACEFVDTFLHLYPDTAVILNVDEDHLDYFKNLDNIIRSFHKFASMATQALIYNGDDANTLRAVEGIGKRRISFGLSQGCDYQARNVRRSEEGVGYCYDLVFHDETVARVETGVPGSHNVLNSLAALAAAIDAGVPAGEAAQRVRDFHGAGRRFEILGQAGGVTIADDYAHHPKEIEVTLRAAQELGFKRVWAVHQPFTYSRTALLLEDFAKALSLSDKVVLSEIMGAREHNTYNIYAKDLAQRIEGCVWFPGFEEIARYVMEHAQPGDLVITLGCGDVYKCAKRMLGMAGVKA